MSRPAFEFAVRAAGKSKLSVATDAGMSTGNLADCLHRGKGLSVAAAERLALAADCPVEVICPELTERFVAVRPGDEVA